MEQPNNLNNLYLILKYFIKHRTCLCFNKKEELTLLKVKHKQAAEQVTALA